MLGRFGKLNNEMEFFRLKNSGKLPEPEQLVNLGILVADTLTSNPLEGAKVSVYWNSKLLWTAETDDTGLAVPIGKPTPYYSDGTYSVRVWGDTVDEYRVTIPNSDILSGSVSLEVYPAGTSPYLDLTPEYLWLNPYNQFKDDVDVLSNVEWTLS